jgi:hypothetical protein
MPDPSDRALVPLLSLRDQFPGGWERSLVEISMRALRDRGVEGVRVLQTLVDSTRTGHMDTAQLVEAVGRTLPLRDASDFLAILQNAEADRLDRARDLLRRALALATVAAGELLRVALGGKL